MFSSAYNLYDINVSFEMIIFNLKEIYCSNLILCNICQLNVIPTTREA